MECPQPVNYTKISQPKFSCNLIRRDGTVHQFVPLVVQKKELVSKIKEIPDTNNMIPPDEIEKEFVNNGSFELICSVSDVDKCTEVMLKPFDLHSQIAKLWESREMGDVTFDVENRSFTCHKLILAARSTVFMAELFGDMAEATQKRIKIEDMSYNVFEAMLHFVYTDSFPSFSSEEAITEMAQHLLEAADRYAMDGLKVLCENHLCASISLGTVAANLVLAEQHNSPRLKNSCLEFLAEPGTLISWTLTNEYVVLVRSFPSIMAEIRAKVEEFLNGLGSSYWRVNRAGGLPLS